MMVIGVTGGIGSGKTVVCNVFRQLGVAVYEADIEAKKLYELPEVQAEVKKEFGAKYFSAQGVLDKKKFGELVFNDAEALKKINAIIHPVVKKRFKDWRKKLAESTESPSPYCIKEAAILFESGTNKDCDKVIVVTAPVELRIQRVMERDGRSREQIEKMISRQWSDEEKIKRADFVIVNDEKKMVIPQVLQIHEKL